MVRRVANINGVSNRLPRARLIEHAEALVGAGPLGDDGADDRQRGAHPDAAQDGGQGGRQLDVPDELARLARKARPISTSRGSTERTPTIVETATGKKHDQRRR